jgi:hypothetical protein
LEGVLAYQMHFRMETTQEPFLPGSYLPIWYRGRNVNKANDGWQTPSNGIVRKAKNEILTFCCLTIFFSHSISSFVSFYQNKVAFMLYFIITYFKCFYII